MHMLEASTVLMDGKAASYRNVTRNGSAAALLLLFRRLMQCLYYTAV